MISDREWSSELYAIAKQIASFEDGPTERGRTTGEAGGGRQFEKVVAKGFMAFVELLSRSFPFMEILQVTQEDYTCKNPFSDVLAIRNPEKERLLIFKLGALAHFSNREGYLAPRNCISIPADFLRNQFLVNEWYDLWLGELLGRGWIPKGDEGRGLFCGPDYPKLYDNMSTKFDGVVVMLENGVLKEKMLVEIKSLKSSNRDRIDGNAHERFSYQNLDYLQIAALYPRTSLLLLTNDAILRYRNKYHAGFGIHALRLSYAFCWYKFEMVSSAEQYVRLFGSWKQWLEG